VRRGGAVEPLGSTTGRKRQVLKKNFPERRCSAKKESHERIGLTEVGACEKRSLRGRLRPVSKGVRYRRVGGNKNQIFLKQEDETVWGVMSSLNTKEGDRVKTTSAVGDLISGDCWK